MSIVICIKARDGIIMVADSRITMVKGGQVLSHDDNGEKLFLLEERAVGISLCGEYRINASQLANEFIDEFDKKIYIPLSVEDTAIQLHLCLKQYDERDNVFYVGGYYCGTGFLYRVNFKGVILVRGSYSAHGSYSEIKQLLQVSGDERADYSSISINEAVNFADYLVQVQIDSKPSSENNCGGPIDILVLTKNSAWFEKHK